MIQRDDGFTLIDVMVGTVVSGLLLAALVGIFQTGYQSLRVSSDAYLGQDDVQLALRYLMPDVQGASREHISVADVPAVGGTLTLVVPEPNPNRLTTVTYVYSDAAGTITRTSSFATLTGTTTEEVVIARHLKTNLLPAEMTRFIYCAAACPPEAGGGTGPKLRAKLAFDINGTTVTRELDLTPKLTSP